MYEIKVSGMTCGSCASSMTHVLKNVDPNVKVKVNLQDQTVHVESDKSEKDICHLIEEAGYPVLASKKLG